jgi:hypothetical protein
MDDTTVMWLIDKLIGFIAGFGSGFGIMRLAVFIKWGK